MLHVTVAQNDLLLVNLDHTTRQFMLAEFEQAIQSGTLYISARLNTIGQIAYPVVMRQALEQHDVGWLAHTLAPYRNAQELRVGKPVKTPTNAMWLLAENEFNHFYMRGVCHRALSEGIEKVIAYRARDAVIPRLRSQAMRGQDVDAQTLLDELRARQVALKTSTSALGLPNSGMSVRLP